MTDVKSLIFESYINSDNIIIVKSTNSDDTIFLNDISWKNKTKSSYMIENKNVTFVFKISDTKNFNTILESLKKYNEVEIVYNKKRYKIENFVATEQ